MKKWYSIVLVVSVALLFGFGVLRWQAQSKASDTTLAHTKQSFMSISPIDGLAMIEKNKNNSDFIILDVRTPGEYAPEHIAGAMNLDYYSKSFRKNLNQLDKSKTYLIYCHTGRRSGLTLDMMRDLGFSEVYDIAGGIAAWKAKGLSDLN
jgi:rhodanese-related sulfurtransferase